MAAAGKLIIHGLMTNPAVGGGDAGVDDKTIVVRAGLPRLHLMAVQTGDALLSMFAHFVFMDDGILVVAMAFRAFAAGPDKVRIRLLNDDAGPLRVDQIRRHDQTRGKDDGDEDGAEVHKASLNPIILIVNVWCDFSSLRLQNMRDPHAEL